jgi:hypothetical protein
MAANAIAIAAIGYRPATVTRRSDANTIPPRKQLPEQPCAADDIVPHHHFAQLTILFRTHYALKRHIPPGHHRTA